MRPIRLAPPGSQPPAGLRRRWRTPLAAITGCAVVAAALTGAAASSVAAGPVVGPHPGGTLTILANYNVSTPDPAVNYYGPAPFGGWELEFLTYDGLVAFNHVSGAAGAEVVPDLTVAIPKPTNGAKTWTFAIRKGIKFSNGTPLKPSDFVRTFERQFTVPGPASGYYYNKIIGATQCLKTPKNCNLSKGVIANDAAGTLTIKLTAPEPNFLDQLALPFAAAVPANTPLTTTGNTPPPGTGPYMWKSYNPNSAAILVRNPYFRQWSASAQPAGNPNEIIDKFGLSPETEVSEVENGQASMLADSETIPPDRIAEVASSHASQLHIESLHVTQYFMLNTRVAPFNNLDARLAVNYAVNRAAYVKLDGGPSLATPVCTTDTGFPGETPYCPFTTRPGDGLWHGVDITKARSLVKKSGTEGMTVTVFGETDPLDKAVTLQFVSDLQSIGYKASAKFLENSTAIGYVQDSANHVQVANMERSVPDYPELGNLINVYYNCASFIPNNTNSINGAEFCNPATQKQLDHTLQVQAVTPGPAALKAWNSTLRAVTNQAAYVCLFEQKATPFLAAGIKGFVWNTEDGTLVDQLYGMK